MYSLILFIIFKLWIEIRLPQPWKDLILLQTLKCYLNNTHEDKCGSKHERLKQIAVTSRVQVSIY